MIPVLRPVKSSICSLPVALLAGCSRNPNLEIVGSYFPGWMLSLTIAVALTLATHSVLRKQGLDHTIGHPAVVYPGLVVLFTCALWLCFFA